MKKTYTIIIIIIFSINAYSQSAGDLDSTFGFNGLATFELENCENFANSMSIHNNKIYLGGIIRNQSNCSNEVGGIARVDTLGILDTSFNATGYTNPESRFWPHCLVNPLNGQVILTGYDRINSAAFFEQSISGYTNTGMLDSTFSNGMISFGTGNNERARGSAISPLTGEVVLIGWTDDFNIMTSKFLPNGEVDSTFGQNGFVFNRPPGFVGARAFDAVFQPDGKIISFGNAGGSGIASEFVFIRYTAQGQLDSTFGTNGYATVAFGPSVNTTYRGYSVEVQPDGKIVAVGFHDPETGVMRLNSDGSLDTTFGTGGLVSINYTGATIGFDFAIQQDGKIVVGIDDANEFRVDRLNPDGTPDLTFGNLGTVSISFPGVSTFRIYDIALLNEGIYAAGEVNISGGIFRMGVVKLRASDCLAPNKPNSGFTFTSNGAIISFSDTSTNNPSNWLWDFGDGNTSTMQNPTHDYGQSGSFTVSLITTNCKGSDSTELPITVVSSLTNGLNKEYGIYPNPASDQLTISGIYLSNYQLSIFNPFGNEYEIEYSQEGDNLVVNTNQLAPGLYILRISDGKRQYVEKVLIE